MKKNSENNKSDIITSNEFMNYGLKVLNKSIEETLMNSKTCEKTTFCVHSVK